MCIPAGSAPRWPWPGPPFDGEHLKHVPHVAPDLQPAWDPRRLHPVPQAHGIGQQQLVAPRLDQCGREAPEIPEQRGQHGGGQLLVPGIGPTHRPDIVQGDGGVQLRPLCIGLPTGRHIRPWGHEDQPGRQPPALLLQPVAQHQRQVSSRRVPRHRHVPGPVALAHQMVPRLHRIVHRRREGVLRGQPVLEGEGVPARHAGQLGGQRPGVAQISAGIAPAVAVQDGVVPVIAPLRPHPGRVHPLQLKGGPLHPDHGGDEPAQHLLSRPLPLQVLRAHGLGRAGRVDCLQGPHHGGQAALLRLRPLGGGGMGHPHPSSSLFQCHRSHLPVLGPGS